MIRLPLFALAMFGLWFWQRPAASRQHDWPTGIPAFAEARADSAYTLANGTAFVAFTTTSDARAVLDSARTAYAARGWSEVPLRMSDTAIFVRGESVAAVLAESLPQFTRVTAIQRPRGL